MKLLIKSLLLIFIISSCNINDNQFREVYFWTDKDFSTTDLNRLEVNSFFAGELIQLDSEPNCGLMGSVRFLLEENSGATVAVRNIGNQVVTLGTISLDDFSDGISVKPADSSFNISVSGSSSDACTKIYLNW